VDRTLEDKYTVLDIIGVPNARGLLSLCSILLRFERVSKATAVKNRGQISDFFTPVKITEGWEKMSDALFKFTPYMIRPSLKLTFGAGPLRGFAWEIQHFSGHFLVGGSDFVTCQSCREQRTIPNLEKTF